MDMHPAMNHDEDINVLLIGDTEINVDVFHRFSHN